MIWWWKSRQWTLAGVAGVACVALVWLVGESLFTTPLSTGITAPQAFVVAVILPLGIARCLGRAGADERRAVRHVAWLDLAVVWPLAMLCAAAMAIVSSGEIGLTAARNVLALTGLVLLCVGLVGARYASLVPVVWLVLAATFGTTATGGAQLWAWVLGPSSLPTWFVTGVLALIGSFSVAVGRRTRLAWSEL